MGVEELGFPGARAAAPLPGECSGGRGTPTLPRAPALRVSRAQPGASVGSPSRAFSACRRAPPCVSYPAPCGSSHSLGSFLFLGTPPLPRTGSGAAVGAAAAVAVAVW